MTPLQQTYLLCFLIYPLAFSLQSLLLICLVWLCRAELARRIFSVRLALRRLPGAGDCAGVSIPLLGAWTGRSAALLPMWGREEPAS